MDLLKLNNRDKRAINRIRKRTNELMLLNYKDDDSNECEIKRQKLIDEQHNLDNANQVPSTSNALTVADSLLEQARALSHELRAKLDDRNYRSKRETVRAILQLNKLQGHLLSEREIAAFLHRMMLGVHNAQRTGYRSNWVRFEGSKKPLQIILLRVNSQDKEMLNTQSDAKFIDEYFQQKWIRLHRTVRDRNNFWHTISTVTQSRQELLIRKIKTHGDPLLIMRLPERKTQLLMSLEQMVDSKFPFPTNAFLADEKVKLIEPTIQTTKKMYRRANELSPIFVLDCEMCFTSADKLELTRITMIDEHGEVLMDELVKPHNKIIDYITHKSGITEQLLKNVNTRLKDVQKKFCSILTDDSILCGHGLENDLIALQLSHPFCIDTSLLFNFSGRLNIRSGLKALAKIFLNEDIQESANGHCSLQDAQATLKLLQLKLDKGLQFGNVALGWNFPEWASQNGLTITGTRIKEIVATSIEEGMEKQDEDGKSKEDGDIATRMNAENSKFLISQEHDLCDSNGNLNNVEEKTGNLNNIEEKTGNLNNVEEKNGNGNSSMEHYEEKVMHVEENIQPSNAVNAGNVDFFDFSEAVRIDNAMQKTASLSDCFHMLYKEKRPRRLLVALPHAACFFPANDSCSVLDLSEPGWTGEKNESIFDPSSNRDPLNKEERESGAVEAQLTPASSPGNNLHKICSQLSPQLINYDFVFVELNCPNGTSKCEMEVAIEKLFRGVCNDAMVLFILSAGESRDKNAAAIMYHKIHRK